MDSQGRLFVADRGNNRIQIFSQEGQLLDIWTQFGRPSGLRIDADDTLYVADGMSGEQWNRGWKGASVLGMPERDMSPSSYRIINSQRQRNRVSCIRPQRKHLRGQVGRQRFEKYIRIRP